VSGPRPRAGDDPGATGRDLEPRHPTREPRGGDAVTTAALRTLRRGQVGGLSRRDLLRRSLGASAAVLLVQAAAGTIGFAWSAVAVAAPRVRVGTLEDLVAANPGLPIDDGFPAYVPAAKAFVVLVDPALGGFRPGRDDAGTGATVNVRALSQRCPHLGCRPNPCIEDYWFQCPCHQSRYDRLGIKALGEAYGPAPRSMDRLSVEVDDRGVLTIHTSHVTLGPLAVALGQPGIIPPRVPRGCG
jgi:cytochrome b6-f complex iron-sulfur subunit